MKCCIPEISWHNRDPVLSVDIQPNIKGDKTELNRLASGGTDSHVLIWYMTLNDSGSINLDLAADLTRHQRAVNVVKWSPNGELLASGDDESVIFIWKLKGESEPVNIVDGANEQDKEIWITLKILRGHMEDVYDLSWCHNSQFLVSGSVDNTAMIWDINKGKSQCILRDHKGFVQGVAWDPQNQYIATLSTDRYMRIFDIQTKKVVSRSGKCTLPVPKSSEFYEKQMRIFHDDTLQTFFRRLCFSPDGKLLITPAGVTDFEGVNNPVHTSYIYSRYSLKQPSIVLPSPDQYTVAAKFCPVLFTLRPHSESNKPAIPLPYRMIFAIATKSSVYLYDTQQQMPFGLISNIHYTRLTDLTWSSDGRILIVSSTDGFCSLITFAEGELGEIYKDAASIIKIRQNDKGKSKSGKGSGTDSKKDNVNKTENENLKRSNDNTSALKMKDVSSHKENNGGEAVNSDKKKKVEVIKANPIAIRRKPRTEEKMKKSENKKRIEDEDEITVVDDQSDTNENIEKDKEINVKEKSELKSNELEIQKSNIDEKLGSEKSENKKVDGMKANPIAIRRKPRTEEKMKKSENKKRIEDEDEIMVVDDQSDTNENIEKDKEINVKEKSELKSNEPEIQKSNIDEKLGSEKSENRKVEGMKASPIAIRRKPRTEEKMKKSESCIENDKKIENKKRIEDKDEIMEVDDQSDTNENIEKDKEINVEEKSELKSNELEIQKSIIDEKLGSEKSENISLENSRKHEEQNTNDVNVPTVSEASNKSDPAQKESLSSENFIDLTKDTEAKDTIKTPSQSERKDNSENDAKTLKNTDKQICPKPEIILDKDIISSDNKFVSPEKKCKPLTPISVRRQPRNSPSTSSDQKIKSSEKNQEKITPSKTPKSVKKATPIAVRKQPRCLIPNPVEKTAIVEEALDAWPIDKLPATVALQPSPDKKVSKVDKQDKSPNVSGRQDTCNISGDRTQDICLIYESSQDSQQIEEHLEKSGTDQEPSGNKTPRRVELKTISTPKSKKKIFD